MSNVTPAGDYNQLFNKPFNAVFEQRVGSDQQQYLYPTLSGLYPGGVMTGTGTIYTPSIYPTYPSPWQYTPEHNPLNSPVPKPPVDIELVQKLLDRGLLHTYQLMQIVGDIQAKVELNPRQSGELGFLQTESKPLTKEDVLKDAELIKLKKKNEFKPSKDSFFKFKRWLPSL